MRRYELSEHVCTGFDDSVALDRQSHECHQHWYHRVIYHWRRVQPRPSFIARMGIICVLPVCRGGRIE